MVKKPPLTQPFLVEIGTEELPPKSLKRLALAFLENFNEQLKYNGLPSAFKKNAAFFTPRRLAIYSPAIHVKQPDRRQEIWGPPPVLLLIR